MNESESANSFQDAVRLARTGSKSEACDLLRQVVATQPAHQAAWLWLAGLTGDQAEAETALAQVRQLNPGHPSLAQAEQWLAQRFPVQPDTPEGSPVVASPLPILALPEPAPPLARTTGPGALIRQAASKISAAAGTRSGLFGFASAGLVLAAIGLGLLLVLGDMGVELNPTARARQSFKAPGQDEVSVVFEDMLSDPESGLNRAWNDRDWTRAIQILEEAYQREPTSQALQERLAQAYIQHGVALRHKGFIEEALPYFKQALVLIPDQLLARRELRLASNYLDGIRLYQDGQWNKVINALQPVWREDGNYVNVNDLLYSAYYNQGLAMQAAGEWTEARDAFRAAIGLRPDLVEPRQEMAEIEFALAPQTTPEVPIPAVSPRKQLIVVGILEQQMWAYEGKRKVFDFVVSTGEPGRDTAIGDFEILDKIDVAYASTWNLDMPYWMGIYWAGPLENGIHSLPIVRHTGYKLWDGYLGQRVSYGCVILSDEDAETLYNWAQVGAKVKIVYSLAEWSLEEEAGGEEEE